MKKLIVLFSLMGLLFLVPTKATLAQEVGPGIKVAVININYILRNGLAFKSIREQIGKYREVFQGEIQKEEESLRNANQELARQRSLLSADAFTEKRREFEKRVVGVQRLVQQRKVNLDRSQSDAMGQIQKVLNEIVTNMAKEQDISLILRQDNTVLAASALQITKQVLERLDAQIPTIKVAQPEK